MITRSAVVALVLAACGPAPCPWELTPFVPDLELTPDGECHLYVAAHDHVFTFATDLERECAPHHGSCALAAPWSVPVYLRREGAEYVEPAAYVVPCEIPREWASCARIGTYLVGRGPVEGPAVGDELEDEP